MSFETEGDARAYAQSFIPASEINVILSKAQNLQVLTRVCEETGVEPGEWGNGTLEWIAGWTDASVGVIAWLIKQAYESGKQAK